MDLVLMVIRRARAFGAAYTLPPPPPPAYPPPLHNHKPQPQPEFLQKFIQYDPRAMGRNIGMLWVLAAGLQLLTYVNVVVRLRATKVVN